MVGLIKNLFSRPSPTAPIDWDALPMEDLLIHGQAAEILEDWNRAHFCYSRARAMGSTEAAIRLSALYSGGRGVPVNTKIALELIREAAEKGDPGGMEVLAIALATGSGIPKDYAAAGRWLEKSILAKMAKANGGPSPETTPPEMQPGGPVSQAP